MTLTGVQTIGFSSGVGNADGEEDIGVSKKLTRKLGLVLGAGAVLLLGTTAVQAEDHESEATVEEEVSESVGVQEKRARHEKEELEGLDTDGDGEPSSAESAETPKKRTSKKAQRLEKFDLDGDGRIDKTERAAMRGKGPSRKQERLEKFDKDGDGKLNNEERAASREVRKAERLAREKEMLRDYDEDGDGKLSRDERMLGVKAHRDQVRADKARARQ